MNTPSYDIIYQSSPWHTRAVLCDETGLPISIRMDEISRPLIEGAVVVGRVRKVSKGLNAAFVDIGDVIDGFLPLNTLSSNNITEGQPIKVRLTRGSTGEKGARLDARVVNPNDIKSTEKIPYIAKKAPPAISRCLMDAGDTPVKVWHHSFIDTQSQLLPYVNNSHLCRLTDKENLWLESIEQTLDNLNSAEFSIPGGGRLSIERTKAITAIDVDSGDISRRADETWAQAVKSTNLRAAKEIVRLCKLQDIGGSIIIDFISMDDKKARRQVRESMQHDFEMLDDRKVEILKMSHFGLLEINREKGGENIAVLLSQPNFIASRILLALWEHVKLNGTAGKLSITSTKPEVTEILKARLNKTQCLTNFGQDVEIISSYSHSN